MPFLDIQLTSWSLDPNGPVLRRHPRPKALRHADFEDKFDALTVFYDCFWIETGRRIALLGPPLLNLHADLDLTFRSYPGGEHCRFRRVPGFHIDTIYVDVPAGTHALQVSSRIADVHLVPQPSFVDLFQNRRVVTTLSQDNEPLWIRDWATYYKRAHGCDGVLIYDNNSTRFSAQEVHDALEPLSEVRAIVVRWPYRYGLFDGRNPISFGIWDWHPCQNAMLEHARRRFLTKARSVLNVDVDELVLTDDGESVFSMVEESSTGHIRMDGLWVENYPMHLSGDECRPPRHKDFHHVRTGRRHGCEEKWAVVPGRTPDAAQWAVHDVLGMPASEHHRRAQLRHFKALNTNWAAVGRAGDSTRRTASSPNDPTAVEPDRLLRDKLADVFPAEPPTEESLSEPTPHRTATSWRLQARGQLGQGTTVEAVNAVERAIALEDDYPPYHLFLGQLRDAASQPEEAAQERAVAQDLRDRDAGYRSQLARLHLEERRFALAEDELVAALAIDSTLPAAHLHMARLLDRSGKRARALAFLLLAVERSPTHALSRAALASRLIEDGRFPEARTHAAVAVELDPSNPHYHVVLGEALRMIGQLDEAEHVLNRGIALDLWPERRPHYGHEVIHRSLEPTDRWAQPTSPNLRHQLAHVFLRKRQFDLAERAALDAIALGPPAVNDHILLARIRTLSGSTAAGEAMAKAIRLARQEFDRPSENENTRLSIREREEYSALVLADLVVENQLLTEGDAVLTEARQRLGASAALEARHARLLDQMGDPAAATALLEEAMRREPHNAELHFALSTVLKGSDRARAIGAAENACKLDPTNADHHVGLSDLLIGQGLLAEAAEILAHAHPILPHHPELKMALARVLEQRGDKPGAISVLQGALALGLSDAWLSSHLGGLLLEVGALEEASEALDRAARVEPDDALTQFRLGRLHEVQGDLSAAVPFFRRAANLADSQGWMWSHLGSALIDLGDVKGAGKALERALDLEPDDWLNHSRFGRLLELQGDIEASIRAVRSAIRKKPDEAWMWSHLGHLLIRQQLWGEAEKAMQQALFIDPDDPVTKERFEHLKELRGPELKDHLGPAGT